MSANEFQIIITLPKSDGMHYRSDRHVAETVQRRIQDFLRNNPVQWNSSVSVDVEKAGSDD